MGKFRNIIRRIRDVLTCCRKTTYSLDIVLKSLEETNVYEKSDQLQPHIGLPGGSGEA